MIVQNDWAHQIAIGRPFQQYYVLLRGELVAPWLVGMLGTLFLGLSNAVITSILEIESRDYVVLSCASLAISTPIILLNATYIDWYDIFMLSLLLACAAVWLCKNGGATRVILAGLCLCFSIGLYQSFFQTAVSLVLMVCLINLIQNKIRQARNLGLRSLTAIFLGGGLTFLP